MKRWLLLGLAGCAATPEERPVHLRWRLVEGPVAQAIPFAGDARVGPGAGILLRPEKRTSGGVFVKALHHVVEVGEVARLEIRSASDEACEVSVCPDDPSLETPGPIRLTPGGPRWLAIRRSTPGTVDLEFARISEPLR